MRRFGILMYRWHAWAGLLSGIFLIIICVSGAIAVFKPELQRAVDWGTYDFDIKPVGEPITPTQAIAAVEEKYKGFRPITLHLPDVPGTIQSNGSAYGFRISGNKQTPARDVLVDPYKGEVVAETRLNDGWGFWLRQLHLRLLYGSFWGRWVVGFFGIVLTFACLSGLWIYLRFNAGHWWPKLRFGRGQRVLWADLHKIIGMAALLFNLIFGVTGAVLGLETLYSRYTKPAVAATSKPAATESDAAEGSEEGAAATPATKQAGLRELPPGMLEACIAQATREIPNTTAASVDLLYRRTGTLRVRVEHSAMSLIAENASSVMFNARTGEVTRVIDASLAPASRRLYLSMEPLHFGRIGGSMIIKLLWGITGLAGGVLSITGYGIYVFRWWKKRAGKRAGAKVSARPALATTGAM